MCGSNRKAGSQITPLCWPSVEQCRETSALMTCSWWVCAGCNHILPRMCIFRVLMCKGDVVIVAESHTSFCANLLYTTSLLHPIIVPSTPHPCTLFFNYTVAYKNWDFGKSGTPELCGPALCLDCGGSHQMYTCDKGCRTQALGHLTNSADVGRFYQPAETMGLPCVISDYSHLQSS